jgi:phosphate transport system substrate-binding protein
MQGSSSGGAKQAVADGTLDVAILLSADIEGEQKEGIELLPLAADPVAFVVHADLPVKSLSAEQLAGIYLGEITSWQEVGGPDAPIVVLTRDEDEGSTKILRKALFNDAPWAASAIVFTKASELADAVQKTPNSIGFGSYGGFVIGSLSEQVLAVDGAHPQDAAQYAIPTRTLAVAYQPARMAQVQPLIDYLKSEAARAVMAEAGVVPQP